MSFTESTNNFSPKEQTSKLPELSKEEIAKMRSKLPETRQDVARIAQLYKNFESTYPEEFKKANQKHPTLAQSINNAEHLFNTVQNDQSKLTDDNIIGFMEEYNMYAHKINSALASMRREEEESQEKKLTTAINGELPINEKEFTAAQQKEMKAFAQDLWKELFPPSNVDKFTKWASGQENLEGYQKILIAPANGIESVIMGFINLVDPKTYKELYSSIKNVSGMSYKDWCDSWHGLKFAYEQLPTADKIAPVISFLYSIAFLIGGSGKIIEMAKKMGYSTGMIAGIEAGIGTRTITHITNPAAKAVEIGTMVGITLPYITGKSK
jgi:hypothetical protein